MRTFGEDFKERLPEPDHNPELKCKLHKHAKRLIERYRTKYGEGQQMRPYESHDLPITYAWFNGIRYGFKLKNCQGIIHVAPCMGASGVGLMVYSYSEPAVEE